jgi:hypothetical protein
MHSPRLPNMRTVLLPTVHMCPNSCVAYTSPFKDLKTCPSCTLSQWDNFQLENSHGIKKIPAQKFYTVPLGPQMQALWQSPESATNMKYRQQKQLSYSMRSTMVPTSSKSMMICAKQLRFSKFYSHTCSHMLLKIALHTR